MASDRLTAEPIMPDRLSVAIFGSNAKLDETRSGSRYCRGILKALHELGHRIAIYQPQHVNGGPRAEDLPWAQIFPFRSDIESQVRTMLQNAGQAEILITTGRTGMSDGLLRERLQQVSNGLMVFWDLQVPQTLKNAFEDQADPFRALVPRFDMVVTRGGGDSVCKAYRLLGARDCLPIADAFEPKAQPRVRHDEGLACDLALIEDGFNGDDPRIQEFFLGPAAALSSRTFLLAGCQTPRDVPPRNVMRISGGAAALHQTIYESAYAVLHLGRQRMTTFGHDPSAELFEAAGAGACIISDEWEGIESFFEPNQEILVARSGDDVVRILRDLTPTRARQLGAAARHRALAEHTYAHRAARMAQLFICRLSKFSQRKASA